MAECRNSKCKKSEGTFASSVDLKHSSTYAKNGQKSSFTCTKCYKTFAWDSGLKRHMAMFHSENGKKQDIICPECHFSFSRSDTLKRHIAAVHSKNKNENDFTCRDCQKTFRRIDGLKRHREQIHPAAVRIGNNSFFIDVKIYLCAICERRFKRKDVLRRHIFRSHMPAVKYKDVFMCAHCPKTFQEKWEIRYHLRFCPTNIIDIVKRLKCVECEDLFRFRSELNGHYEKKHSYILEYENLEFSSTEAFEKWKIGMERDSVTHFFKRGSKKTQSLTIASYFCHRSQSYDHRRRTNKVRHGRYIGSKKLPGVCPAEIVAQIDENGQVTVTFQKTHVGHNICDLREMRYIGLPKDEKIRIAEELAAGVPVSTILQRKYSPSCPAATKSDRLHYLQYRDCYNIALKYGLRESISLPSPKPPRCKDDQPPTEIPDKLPLGKEIVYCKNRNSIDERYVLDKEDLMVVVMDDWQQKYLLRYGHNVISLDSTHGGNTKGVLLHTMLVLDVECEGIPVAFAITNRHDDVGINVFLSCIRDRIGRTLQPYTLITDLQLGYYSSWLRIMQPPTFYLFCSWHVQEAWRRNLCKVADATLRRTVHDQLRSMCREMDPIVFEQKLKCFLSTDKDGIRPFIDYFRQNFALNATCWAYCYRQHARINTNMHIRSFRRLLKHRLSGGGKISSLADALLALQKYLRFKQEDMHDKAVMGKDLQKQKALTKSHRAAIRLLESCSCIVDRIDSQMWYVESVQQQTSQEDNDIVEMYMVQEVETMDCAQLEEYRCELVCDGCLVCFHRFRCSCIESSIKANMCEHIHMVGLKCNEEKLPIEERWCEQQLDLAGRDDVAGDVRCKQLQLDTKLSQPNCLRTWQDGVAEEVWCEQLKPELPEFRGE